MSWSSAPTFVTGSVVTAAQLNILSGDLNVIGSGWATYTPVWSSTGTAPSIGNGGLGGFAMLAGKTVLYRIFLQGGSTTTYGTGTWGFSLPVFGNITAGDPVGYASANDGTTNHPCMAIAVSNSTIDLVTCSSNAFVTPTVPFTFTNGQTLIINGSYQAA